MSVLKKDFLRHIVNKVLANRGEGLSRQAMDDVRRFISKAEEKYKFSVFGGSISNLARYLASSDFDDVITIFKSAGRLDILRQILEEARSSYKDVKEVTAVIDGRLRELEAGAERELSAQERVKGLLERLPWVRNVELEDNRVVARGSDVELTVEVMTPHRGKGILYELVVRGEVGDPSELLPSLANKLKNLT